MIKEIWILNSIRRRVKSAFAQAQPLVHAPPFSPFWGRKNREMAVTLNHPSFSFLSPVALFWKLKRAAFRYIQSKLCRFGSIQQTSFPVLCVVLSWFEGVSFQRLCFCFSRAFFLCLRCHATNFRACEAFNQLLPLGDIWTNGSAETWLSYCFVRVLWYWDLNLLKRQVTKRKKNFYASS